MASCMLPCPGLVPGTGSASKWWVAAGKAMMAFSPATLSTQKLCSELLFLCPLLLLFLFKLFDMFYIFFARPCRFGLFLLCSAILSGRDVAFSQFFWQGCCILIALPCGQDVKYWVKFVGTNELTAETTTPPVL